MEHPQVVGFTLRPNTKDVFVQVVDSRTVRSEGVKTYTIKDGVTKVCVDGVSPTLEDVIRWFQGREDTVYTTIFMEIVEKDGHTLHKVNFVRK